MLQASLSKVTGHCRQKIYKMQTQLTTEQISSLEDKIYGTLITSPGMDMGDMGNCREAAYVIISEWMEENNIIEQEN